MSHETKRGKVRKNFYLPTSLVAELESLADKRQTSMTEVLRTALEVYFGAVKRAEEAKKDQKHG